ncbi:hypothetical protein [Methanothrix sp.]|uniref:hypothetical protein n=1 Tax=Methanothrix sp. TaxID=90426 RepID=UPI003C71F517
MGIPGKGGCRRSLSPPAIATDWQSRLILEMRRKAIHLSGLSVPLSLLLFGRGFAIGFVALALAVSLILEWQRLKGRIRLPEVRAQEEHKVASFIYYIAGCLFCLLFLPEMIAVNAVLLLSLGDTISGLAGSVLANADVRSRRVLWGCKPLSIIAIMFSGCLLIGYLASGITRLSFPVYLAGAAAATAADGVCIIINGMGLDDNFSIPVFSGLVMAVVAAAL